MQLGCQIFYYCQNHTTTDFYFWPVIFCCFSGVMVLVSLRVKYLSFQYQQEMLAPNLAFFWVFTLLQNWGFFTNIVLVPWPLWYLLIRFWMIIVSKLLFTFLNVYCKCLFFSVCGWAILGDFGEIINGFYLSVKNSLIYDLLITVYDVCISRQFFYSHYL